MQAQEILDLIHKKYEGDAYIVLDEVPNGIGMHQSRWIDAAVFGLWPSKSLDRSAFEIKVNRSDFIHELQNHQKHKWVQESFHQFWFVAPLDVVQLEELPNGAGFMYPRGDKLCIKRHCVRNDNPKLDDRLLAAFMRAAWKAIQNNSKISEATILANSKDHQRYKLFSEAVQQFCKSRNVYGFYGDETKEQIIQNLEKATIDNKLSNEKDQILAQLDNFQSEIARIFEMFAILARYSLLAKNAAGEYIVSAYGHTELKDIKPSMKSDYRKRADELINLILNWDKLSV